MVIKNESEVEPKSYTGEAKGVEMRELLTKADGTPSFAMRVFRLEAGGHTPRHLHDWEHEVFILEGEGSVLGPQGERSLRPGDAVLVSPNEEHQFRAGGGGMRFICCVPNR